MLLELTHRTTPAAPTFPVPDESCCMRVGSAAAIQRRPYKQYQSLEMRKLCSFAHVGLPMNQ